MSLMRLRFVGVITKSERSV